MGRINPKNVKQVERLADSIRWSRAQLDNFRQQRLSHIDEFCGSHYNQVPGREEKRVPQNLLELAVSTYVRHMSARPPRVLVSTSNPQLIGPGAKLEAAMNRLVKEIKLVRTLRKALMEAMFGIGIVKVYTVPYGLDGASGYLHDEGQPAVDVVTMDDWVHDMAAESMEEIDYAGNCYWQPLDVIKECDLFRKEWRDKLKAGDEQKGAEERASDGERDGSTPKRYTDYVRLMDLWLPREGLMLTCRVEDDVPVIEEPGRVVEWEGPEHGPYHTLSFIDVPGRLMPLSPAANLRDQHDLVNQLDNKLTQQALAAKTLNVYGGSYVADAERAKNAVDGEFIRIDGQGTSQVKVGGIDQQTLAYSLRGRQIFDDLSGVPYLAGMGAQSPTASQDEMFGRAANVRIDAMQGLVLEFTTGICEDLAYYVWSDPLTTFRGERQIPGTAHVVPIYLEPEDRENDLIEHELSIEPYSMTYRPPSQRLAVLMQFLQQIIMPLMPLLQQRGIELDVPRLTEIAAKLGGIDELKQILREIAAGVESEESAGGEMRQSPVTTRNYVRTNRPGANRQQQAEAAMTIAMGGRPQPKEMATLSRAAG